MVKCDNYLPTNQNYHRSSSSSSSLLLPHLVDYADADQDPSGEAMENAIKQLVYYELDLGLNHVIRKWSQPIASTAFMLLQVPGERAGGPGG